jgi:hypothetical protein
MTEFSIISCDSWQQFKAEKLPALFESKPFHRGRFLFRGQGKFDWPLESSFDRWFEGKGQRAEKADVAKRLLDFFQENAEGVEIERDIWNDTNRRLALAQHHGLPTRLLDWSESAYIAAFFAYSNLRPENAESKIAIWCLDQSEKNVWSKESGVEILRVPTYGNDRLRSQMGWFTYLRAKEDTLEEYVRGFPEAPSALRRFEIPAREVRFVLADLGMMGIDHARIFPGLSSNAMDAELRVRWERTPNP